MAEREGEDNVLDYATPPPLPPPLKWRDSAEYYREPPSTDWAVALIVVSVVAVVCVILGCLGVVRLPIG